MSTRQSDKFIVSSRATICTDVDLRGEITIGPGTVLHPRASILALGGGAIVIGKGNIIEENATILNRRKEPMIIGDYNHFEVGCRVECPVVGSSNTFGGRCRLTAQTSVTDRCTIGAGCQVAPQPFFDNIDEAADSNSIYTETLPSQTVIYGKDAMRRKWTGVGADQARALHLKHLEVLREILPQYGRVKQAAAAESRPA
ncbi:hypothetical protein E5Q_05988 [Mixia osmundae IAM 14324]|uniref:Dynactin subunit 6 n=1 Tax=Mixia osmundae (strain CBS 9802 / IAM 14324 / JCM 22182 / KY 12970) TaxID=764103 RepID=G7E9H4_MIXOS|nr:hypothetical protein E5Q_05988 [Mixia osmundae IAM 14324]